MKEEAIKVAENYLNEKEEKNEIIQEVEINIGDKKENEIFNEKEVNDINEMVNEKKGNEIHEAINEEEDKENNKLEVNHEEIAKKKKVALAYQYLAFLFFKEDNL